MYKMFENNKFNLNNFNLQGIPNSNKENDLIANLKKNQNTPPDLDEIWTDFNKRISNIFNNQKKRGISGIKDPSSRDPDPKPPRQVIFGLGGFIILVIFTIWLFSGFFIVQEGQVAVVTRFGCYKQTVQAGFQWRLPYPIEKHSIVNISQLRTFEIGFRGSSRNKMLSEALMLTNDENIVDMQFVVQYRLRADGAPNYLFKVRNPDDSVRQAAETAMREVVGKKPMDFVLYEGRTDVTAEVQNLMQIILNYYGSGIQVSTVAIQNVQPPEQVQAAFDDAVKAGQDRERQINEGQAYANQVIPWASGQASRMVEEAEGKKARIIGDAQGYASRFISVLKEYEKAPEITRDRMYLETMEKMFSEASKIMIDNKNCNNFLYLPIEKTSSIPGVNALSFDSHRSNQSSGDIKPLLNEQDSNKTSDAATGNALRDRTLSR